MVRRMAILLSVLIHIPPLVNLRSALACECGPQVSVLQAFENSDLVIIAKAVSVEKADRVITRNFPYVYGVKSTTMVIEKVYKGDAKNGEELIFDQGGTGNCVFTFEEKDIGIGNRYLFYLNRPQNSQSGYIHLFCGRSNDARSAVDDLLYLEDLDNVRGKTRISGRVSNFSTGFAYEDARKYLSHVYGE